MSLPHELWVIIAHHVPGSLEPLSRVDKLVRGAAKRVQKHRHDAILKIYKNLRYIQMTSLQLLHDYKNSRHTMQTYKVFVDGRMELRGKLIAIVMDAPLYMQGIMHLMCKWFDRDLIKHDVALAVLNKYPDELGIFVEHFKDVENHLFKVELYSCLLHHNDIKSHIEFAHRMVGNMMLDMSEYASAQKTQKLLDLLSEAPMLLETFDHMWMDDLCNIMKQFWQNLAEMYVEAIGDTDRQSEILHFMDQNKLVSVMEGLWRMCDESKRPPLNLVIWRALQLPWINKS